MVDFSDAALIHLDDVPHFRCPVCESKFYDFSNRAECEVCNKLRSADLRENRLPPRFKSCRGAFTLQIWQKYRIVERKYAQGEYTREQMQKILCEVDEYALNDYEEKERKLKAAAESKPLRDLKSRKHYTY